MGKRVLSSPKKRSPQKKGGASKGASKLTLKQSKESGTVSVADLFTRQKQIKAAAKSPSATSKVSEIEVIDISNSPRKSDQNASTSSEQSPYFSPNKNTVSVGQLLRVNTEPPRRALTKLSLKRKHNSEPRDTRLASSDTEQKQDFRSGEAVLEEKDLQPSKTMDGNSDRDNEKKPKKSRLSRGKRNRSGSPALDSGKESKINSTVLTKKQKSDSSDIKEKAANSSSNAKPTEGVAKDEGESDTEESDQYRVPYYVENFKLIVKSILEDNYYEELFNEKDLHTVEKFNNLSEEGQKLYVRLFGRKFKWIIKSKIKYPKIAEDLSEPLCELVDAGLLLDESSMDDLEEILTALPAPELQNLAKSLKLNLKNQQKQQLIDAVLKHSKQKHIGAFFNQGANTRTKILKSAKELLGKCYKLVKDCRAVFSRLMMLFSLHLVTGDEDEAVGQQQIFQMLMSNIGRIKYPAFTVLRETRIYKTREDLLRFESAIQLSSDIYDAFESRDFDCCLEMYFTAKRNSKEVWEDQEITRCDADLPEYLRWFTAGAVYARIFTYGVETLQRKKLYKEAVELLEELTSQKVYHPDYRGRWYDRLALNTEQHLKQPGKALDIIKAALSDDRVRTGHRLSLFQRASRICHANQHKKLHHRWKEFKDDPMAAVKDAPTVTIEGTLCPHSMPGEGRMWVSKDSYTNDTDEVTLIKRVEDVALVHFRDNGYPKGIHGESGTFSTLLCLFFWDIIFKDEIPDTFHSAYQSVPLDYQTDHFYLNRKDLVDEKLQLISNSSEKELHEMVSKTWTEHYETFCAGLNWERFLDLDHALGLVSCIGGKILSGIFERMVKNMRHVRSGMPDLVVWNTDTKEFRVVEVKGPNDRLSTKQILWLDYLVRLGVQAETCHVVAVAAKKLKTSSSVGSIGS